MPYNERELLQRIAEGDEAAFRTLFNFHRPRLYTAALRVVGDAAQAKDIYQDTFLKVWLKRDMLAGMENFTGWLFTIARNLMYDSIKHSSKVSFSSSDSHEDIFVDIADMPEYLLHKKEIQQVLQKAIERLPDKQRETYNLIKVYGLSRLKAAAKMNVSSETVKSNLEHAIRSIRAYCQKELDFVLFIAFIVIFL